MKMEIGDKLLLWFAGLIYVLVYGVDSYIVVAALVAAIIVCVRMAYVKYNYIKYIHEIMTAGYLVMVIIEPVFAAYAPLMMYDIIKYKMNAAALAYICAFVSQITESFITEPVIAEADIAASVIAEPTIVAVALSCAFTVIAIVMSLKTAGYQRLSEQIKHISDDAREKNIILYDRNNELMARQDYEVHVATLEERNRIAREIHDNVGHMITRAILMTGAIKTLINEETVKPYVDDLSDTLNQAMNSIRASVHDLHDDAINLEKAVKEMIDAFPNFKTDYEYSMAPEVPKELKMCFIAVIKEALNNVAKHSNGDRVSIVMREQPGFYQLMISDNGTVSGDNLLGGMGLSNMKERVRKLGGSFNVLTEKGFTIMVSIMK